jgi:hypothetical protein
MEGPQKAFAHVLTVLVPVVIAVLPGGVNAQEYWDLAIAAAGAVGVYLVPNLPKVPVLKAGLAIVVAGLMAVPGPLLDGRLSTTEWQAIAFAAFGAFATWYFPNQALRRPVAPR